MSQFSPPKLFVKFFQWFCKEALQESILGDLLEQFEENVQQYGIRKAKRRFAWNVIRFFRPGIAKSFLGSQRLTQHGMFKNYAKVGLRNILMNKTYAIINILGMGFALACCIVAFLNLDYKLRFDDHHLEQTQHVYRLNTIRQTDDGPEKWGVSPVALGSSLKADFPGIDEVMRWHSASGIVTMGGKTIAEKIHYADMQLLNVFNFPLVSGNESAFTNPEMVVLNQETALKYFGSKDPIGQEIRIVNGFHEKTFLVGAVTQHIPENTSLQFDVLIPISHLFKSGQFVEHDWGFTEQLTLFVKLPPQQNPLDIDKKLDRYIPLHNKFREDMQVTEFYLQAFKELAYTSDVDLPHWVRGRALNRNAIGFLVGITIFLSLLILLTSFFNFTNTSIASSSRRLKEVGIRKVIGGTRKQLVLQFIVENVVLSLFSVLIGIFGAVYLIDGYNAMFEQQLDLRYIFKSRVVIFVLTLPVITGILAGAYPAYQISKHMPVSIFKGKTEFARFNWLNKTLLTAQFGFCCFALICAIILTQNSIYQKKVDFGYDLRKILVVPVNNVEEAEIFRNTISNNKAIKSIALSSQIIGQSTKVSVKLTHDDQDKIVRILSVGPAYLKTTGIKLTGGRGFEPASNRDLENSIIVNQNFVNNLGIQRNPVDQEIILDDKTYVIVGVVENHKEFGLAGKEPACVFTMSKQDQTKYISVLTSEDKVLDVHSYLSKTWFKTNPNKPFGGFLQQMSLYKQLHISDILGNLSIFLALSTLIMSIAGFYSIVSLTIHKRMKEIAIRKVFGGSVSQIIQLISKSFISMILVSFLLGSVSGYFVIQKLLFSNMFFFHSSGGIEAFIFTLFLVILIPLVTIGAKMYKTARINPIHILRDD